MSALRELLVSVDIDTGGAESKLSRVDSAVTGVAERLGGLVEAFAGSEMLGAIKDFVEGQIAAAVETEHTAERLGTTTDELQAFSYAASLSGVSAEGAAHALQFLSKNMSEASDGSAEQSAAFARLGVQLKGADGQLRGVADVFPDLAEGFAKLQTPQERTALAMKLFGRSGAELIPLLSEGAEGVAALTKDFEALGGGMDKDFITKASEAHKQTARMNLALTSLKSRVAAGIVPTVAKFAERITSWVQTAQKFVAQTNVVKEGVAVLGVVVSAAALKAGVAFAKMLGLLRPGKATIIETLIEFAPFALIAAVFVAVGLAIEDVWTTLDGGEGIIIPLLQKFLGVEQVNDLIDQLRDAWTYVLVTMRELEPDLADVGKSLLAIGKDVLPYVVAGVVDLVRALLTGITATTGLISMLAKLPEAIKTGDFGKVFATVADTNSRENAIWKRGSALLNQATSANTGEIDRSYGNNWEAGGKYAGADVTMNNHVVNNITTTGDPQSIARAARDGTQKGLTQADIDDSFASLNTGG